MKQIGFLVDDSAALSEEERAAWEFLRRQRQLKPRTFSFQQLSKNPSLLRTCSTLWWHHDSSIAIPGAAISSDVLDRIREFVARGNSLLLSLLASQYVVDLGIESTKPNVVTRGVWNNESWAKDYPDIRGFASFQGHPIFSDMGGGAYTWCPTKGIDFAAALYDGTCPSQGKVVGVERLYIKLQEEKRLVAEYKFDKGRVLAIGSYFFFRDRHQRFRPQLESFTLNCLSYLGGPLSQSQLKKTYWNFDQRTVRQVPRESKPLKTATEQLKPKAFTQAIQRDLDLNKDTDQFFSVSGKRVLMMGKERGGLSEVWTHPVRIAKNVQIAFRVGDGQQQGSHDLSPHLIVQPQCVMRRYRIDGALIEETLLGDADRPAGAIHYSVESKEPVHIVLTGQIDLRQMWPLSHNSTGSLSYGWDKNLHAAVVTANTSTLFSIVGGSIVPTDQLVGQFASIRSDDGTFVGELTNERTVAVAMRFMLGSGHSELTIGFAGSNRSVSEVEKAYRGLMMNPAAVLKRQERHFTKLLNTSTQIETPDQNFNDGYRWALTSTDRLFVETPGLGSSFMAGFGTTERGWDGGQAVSGRPGYAWYFGRDSVWTSFAVLAYGDFAKVRSVLEFLGQHQDVGGKILHEMTSSGFAHYDAADSTPLYLILMGRYLRASGDRAFVKHEFDRIQKAIEFCYSTDTDGDHLIENANVGHGWVEGGALFPIHVEHYLVSCWAEALKEVAMIAGVLKKRSLASRWQKESRKVRHILNRDFWNERTQFYNFGKLSDGSFNEERTLLPAVGVSFGLSDGHKAGMCLDEYASANFSADWGTRIIGNNNPLFDPSGYHYGSIWPLFTGWTSLAEFRMNRPVQGFMHAMSNLQLYNVFAAGTVEEVLHGEKLEATGVCSHQAWSESMVLQPLLEGMLGIDWNAFENELILRPYFPPQWNKVTVRNIHIEDSLIDLNMTRTNDRTEYLFRYHGQRKLNVIFQPRFMLGTVLSQFAVDKRAKQCVQLVRSYEESPIVEFQQSKNSTTRIAFTHTGGIGLVPPLAGLTPFQESRGLRVIREEWNQVKYSLTLEGKAGSSYLIELVDRHQVITSVRGGRIEERNEERLRVRVDFEATCGINSYQRTLVDCVF